MTKRKVGRPAKGRAKYRQFSIYLDPVLVARLERIIIMAKGEVSGNLSSAVRKCVESGVDALERQFGEAKIVLQTDPSVGASKDDPGVGAEEKDTYTMSELYDH